MYTKCLGSKQNMSLFLQVLWPIGINLSTRPWLKRTFMIPEMLPVNHISFLWYVSLCKLNSIKAQGKRCSGLFSETLASLFSPSRSCLGSFILICNGQESSVGQSSPIARAPYHQANSKEVHTWSWAPSSLFCLWCYLTFTSIWLAEWWSGTCALDWKSGYPRFGNKWLLVSSKCQWTQMHQLI